MSGKFAIVQIVDDSRWLCFDRNEQKMKRRFSRSILRHDGIWTFAVLLRAFSLLFSTIRVLGQVVRDYRFVAEKFLLRKFFAREKAVNSLSAVLAVDADKSMPGIEFECKRNFAQLSSFLQSHFIAVFINYLLFFLRNFSLNDWRCVDQRFFPKWPNGI